MKFGDSASLVEGRMKRLVIIQLGDRETRNAMDKLCTQDISAVCRKYGLKIKCGRYNTHSEVCLAFLLFAGTMKDWISRSKCPSLGRAVPAA